MLAVVMEMCSQPRCRTDVLVFLLSSLLPRTVTEYRKSLWERTHSDGHCSVFFLFLFLIQEILIAVGVRGATLQHKMAPPCSGWYDQVGLNDYFPVAIKVRFLWHLTDSSLCHRLLTFSISPMSRCWDMPLLPRSPPYTYTCGAALLTTGKVGISLIAVYNLQGFRGSICSICCRPLYLPLRSLLVVETFSISSSVSLDHSSSSLRYVGAVDLAFMLKVTLQGAFI